MKIWISKSLYLHLLLTITFSSFCFGQVLSDSSTYLGAESAALGGATSAANLSHDSLIQNPASSVFKSQYAVSGAYSVQANTLSASIVDTKSGPVGGGVYYLHREVSASEVNGTTLGDFAKIENIGGGALMGKLNPNFGFGVTAKYLDVLNSETKIKQSAWNFDVGGKYNLGSVQLGFLYQNLKKDEKGLTLPRIQMALNYDINPQLSVMSQVFKVLPSEDSLFLLPSQKDVGWSVGAQFTFNKDFSIKAGYLQNDPWAQTIYSAGLGYSMNNFSINYAFQRIPEEDKILHSAILTGYF